MEFTMRTVVILLLALVVVIVCATIIFAWSNEANGMLDIVFKPFQSLFS